MDISKALALAADFRAEGQKLLDLAAEIESAAKKASNGAGAADDQQHARHTKGREKPDGYRAVAIEVLREHGRPMHVTEMLPKIAEKMGREVTRPNVEGALVRAVSKGDVKRPRPSTFALP